MLSENQITSVWERQISAEVRSLYFGELASKYSREKQVFTFMVFFLSSGAAATLIAKLQPWVPITLSILVSIITAYTIAVNLDVTIRTMAKFHSHGVNWRSPMNRFGAISMPTMLRSRSKFLRDVSATCPN